MIYIAIFVATAAVAGFVFFRAGIKYRKSQAEAAIGSAEKESLKQQRKRLTARRR